MKNSKVEDRTDMNERLEQLDREWRRRYEELENMRQRQLRDLGDKMYAVITVVCDAIKVGVHDVDTIMKMGRVVQNGLARLRAIDAAAEAEREPGAPLN
jgi:hypothetical protein